MPLTRFKLSAISDGGITNAKLADDAVNTDELADNIEVAGTEAVRMPVGTTAERSNAQSGDIRFNTTIDLMEYYDGTEWKAIDAPPVVTSISPTTETGANADITITGSNFQSGATVKFIGDDGTEYTSPTVTRNSSTEIVAETPATPLGSNNEPYDVKVTNPSGLSATLEDTLDAGDPPSFNTAAGAHTLYDGDRGDGFDASATDPDGDTITYSLQSGSLPTGGTLNTSTGIITGISAVGSDTASTFTIRASTAGGDTTDRQFVLTVKAPITQTFSYTGSNQSFSVPSGLNTITATMWGAAGGFATGESYSDAGGAGGFSTGDIDVSNISSFVIQVGQGGTTAADGAASPRAWPNGGSGSARSGYRSGAGGGLSGIFDGSVSFANAIMIAGGGGGAGGHGGGGDQSGSNMSGGAGGGSTGEDGWGLGTHNSNGGGGGGSQSAAGSQNSKAGYDGRSPGQLIGGDAGDGTAWSTGWNAAGGGGDGYYGGGAREGSHAGGGGGSGYVGHSSVSNGTTTANTSSNGKKTTNNPPQTGNTHWSSGIGVGSNSANGGNGKVVLTY